MCYIYKCSCWNKYWELPSIIYLKGLCIIHKCINIITEKS